MSHEAITPSTATKRPRVILYARTSADTEEAGEKISIEEQIRDGQRLAQQNGYDIIDTITDRNRSGRTFWTGCPLIEQDPVFLLYFQEHIGQDTKKTRDGLARVVSMLDRVDFIVVRDETRLMRPLLNSFLETAVWQTLAHHNVAVHSCTEGVIRAGNHEDQLLSRLKANTKDKDISTRLRDSKVSLHAIRDAGGLYQAPNFYGFRSNGHQRVRAIKPELRVVRRIFTEFLAGTAMMGICKRLNDEKIPNRNKYGLWQRTPLKAILQRPAYCGHQHNTHGELIPARAFLPHAVVTLDEFRQVQRRLVKSEGAYRERQHVHPLSGLLRCGTCGKFLTTFQTISMWNEDRVKSRYYFCQYGKNYLSNAPQCKAALIRESFSPQVIKPGVSRNGNGLVEFVFPLLLPWLFKQMVEPVDKGQTRDDLDLKRKRLDEISGIERKLLEKNLAGIIDEHQFDNLMAEYRAKREKLTSELDVLNHKLAGMTDAVLPIEHFLNPAAFKLTPETMRELAQQAFECIMVWPMKVRVVMKDGGQFEVERCKINNARVLPHWRARIIGSEVGRGTKVEIVYFYKSCRQYIRHGKLPVKVVFNSPNLRVVTMGVNDIYTKTHLRPYQYAGCPESEWCSRVEIGPAGGKRVEHQLDMG